MNFSEAVSYTFDVFIHLDKHLAEVVKNYQVWTYGLVFLVVFCGTGLVVTPFLPGDSLLFAAGSLAGSSEGSNILNPHFLFIVISIAAILGDTVNYWIGHLMGPKVFKGNTRFLKKEYLEKTHKFYEKHGGKTIIIARFIPIIRTFAPFVAGIGAMSYGKFILYNIIGGLMWVALFIYTGYFFGTLPFVKNNFSYVIIAIILISVVPIFIEFLRNRKPKIN